MLNVVEVDVVRLAVDVDVVATVNSYLLCSVAGDCIVKQHIAQLVCFSCWQ